MHYTHPHTTCSFPPYHKTRQDPSHSLNHTHLGAQRRLHQPHPLWLSQTTPPLHCPTRSGQPTRRRLCQKARTNQTCSQRCLTRICLPVPSLAKLSLMLGGVVGLGTLQVCHCLRVQIRKSVLKNLPNQFPSLVHLLYQAEVHVCVYVCVHVCLHVYVCVHVCLHVYVCVHVYM